MPPFFPDLELVSSPPIKRAAYSDRTAYIMAELSRLVYEILPAEGKTVESSASASQDESPPEGSGAESAASSDSDSPQQRQIVTEVLAGTRFEFVSEFVAGDSEAMLVKLGESEESEGMLILVFRGTQADSDIDMATDLKADLVHASVGGRVHRGFMEAFDKIRAQIESALAEQDKRLPLYITGHSLGGALAMVATRYLAPESQGATYTFGCPRAADDEFYEPLKTPVYRVVNAADGITRVPFGRGLVYFLTLVWLIPFVGPQISEWIRRRYVGYTHHGSMILLNVPRCREESDCDPLEKLVVRKSPGILWHLAVVVPRLIRTLGKATVADHDSEAYSTKLLAYAQRRNR